MAKRKPNPNQKWISQAAEQATVRYGPELSGLKELMRQAMQTRDQSIASATGTAQSTQAAVAAALPFIAQVYGKAGTGASQAGTLLSHDLQGLGPAADYLKGAGATEQAAGLDRINAARAFAQSTLADRAVRASEGAQSGANAAWSQFASTTKGISNRLGDLNNEIGAFKSATLGDLLAQQTKNNHDIAQQQRQQNFQRAQNRANRQNAQITAGVNPDGTVTPGGPKDPKIKPSKTKSPWASDAAIASASNTIASAIHQGKVLKASGASRPEIAEILRTGAKEQNAPIYRTVKLKNGGTKQERVLNPDGTPKMKTVPGIDPVKSEALLGAAVDIAVDGHLSKYTVAKLHRLKIPVKALGYKTWRDVQ